MRDLDFAERSAREEQIDNADAHSSTIDWIWNTGEERCSFTLWLQNNEPIFWIQGKPGSGKSTLIHQLIRTKRVKEILKSASKMQWTIAKFFDFRAGKDMANSLEGFIRSLCIQLIRFNPDIVFDLETHPDPSDDASRSWSLGKLRRTLCYLLQRLPQNICIFVDGLDEYEGDISELLIFIKTLSHDAPGVNLLKICLASRPESLVTFKLERYPGFAMQDYNLVGIEEYVSITIKRLYLTSDDESHLLKLVPQISKRAEGVFLWARFALPEIVGSRATGETYHEMQIRLEALPPGMEELYNRIFNRMNPQARNTARLLFQLTLHAKRDFPIYEPTSRMIKEAESLLRGANPSFSAGLLRNSQSQTRCIAKAGGLLEEVEQDSPGRMSVKTIHRSVDTFLKHKGWLNGIDIGGQEYSSPRALWLYVCCRYLEHVFGVLDLDWTNSGYEKPMVPENQEGSLLDYVLWTTFSHGRELERVDNISSFEYLSQVSDNVWLKLWSHYRFISSYDQSDPFNDSPLVNFRPRLYYLDRKRISDYRQSQPWQIMVEQYLPLCVRDALRTGRYAPGIGCYDVCLALRAQDFEGYGDVRQLIATLLEAGVQVTIEDILECFEYGTSRILKDILAKWPNGKIKLNKGDLFVPAYLNFNQKLNFTYDRKPIGALWELVRSRGALQSINDLNFEAMLDVLISRGEDLNEVCEHGGTMLHAIVICEIQDPYRNIDSMQSLLMDICLTRGADVNIPGPHGTPLQMIWKITRNCNLGGHEFISMQKLAIFLKSHGARCDWVEPDGSIVNGEKIDALCAINDRQQQIVWCQPRLKCPDWYTWNPLSERDTEEATEDDCKEETFNLIQSITNRCM